MVSPCSSMKASMRAGVAGHQRRRDELGEARDRQLLVVVADRARPVEDARALALGAARAGTSRRRTPCRTAGPCACSTAAKSASGALLGSPGAVPVVVVAGERQRHDARRDVPPRPSRGRPARSAKTAWPRARERAHHRDARVLVGLELGQRVEDEGEVHVGGGGRGSIGARQRPGGGATGATGPASADRGARPDAADGRSGTPSYQMVAAAG